MLNRINQYLLTHYPLIWNLRLPWILSVILLIHLFFGLAGYLSLDYSLLQRHYSVSSINGGQVYTLSILFSLLVIVGWLLFYLRNNAYKSFYAIGRKHLAIEFALVVLVLTGACSFFLSYHQGARIKVRQLIPRATLVHESNVLNLALAFIPQDKNDYFKINSCDERALRNGMSFAAPDTNAIYNHYVTADSLLYTRALKIVREPGAFSYRYFCNTELDLGNYPAFLTAKERAGIINNWLTGVKKDSVISILQQVLAISRKYSVPQDMHPDTMVSWVFADSLFSINQLLGQSPFAGSGLPELPFFSAGDITRVLSLADECYLENSNSSDWQEQLTVLLYFALSAALLLISYRFFSRRVFLISVVGTVVWCILFALLAASSYQGDSVSPAMLVTFVIITMTGCLLTFSKTGSKTISGVLLCWQAYGIPFILPIIAFLIAGNYERQRLLFVESVDVALLSKTKYPVGYWISTHSELIMQLNLLFVFLYMICCFTWLARRWYSKPEE
ncbi:MAG: hypothetical protein QM781_07935 [Chitinophagaceae bacterium]